MKLEKAILAAGEDVVFWNRPFGILIIDQTELSFRLLHSLIKTTSSLTVVRGFVHRLYIDYQCTIQHIMYNEKIQTAIRPSVSEIS